MHVWPYELLDRIAFAMSSVLPKPVPYTAELPTVTLLSHFTPKLADVTAALEQAFVKITGIDVDRVWVAARRPFRKRASLYPSLHGAKTDIELPSNIGLADTTIDQGSHLFIEAVPALAILLFRRESRSGRNLNCCERLANTGVARRSVQPRTTACMFITDSVFMLFSLPSWFTKLQGTLNGDCGHDAVECGLRAA
jgi:hypothetical protein